LVFCRADAHEEAYWSDEMRALAHSAGVRIVAEARQKRPLPDVATYIGKGKAETLFQLAREHEADVIDEPEPTHPRAVSQRAGW